MGSPPVIQTSAPSNAAANAPWAMANLLTMAPSVSRILTTFELKDELPLFATHIYWLSKAIAVGRSPPVENVPRTVPSLARSFATVTQLEPVIQILAPSKASSVG